MKHIIIIIIIILSLLSITINAQGIRLNSKQSVIDSTRLNATGDSLYYYQNGVLLSTGAIGSGSMITGTGTVNYLPKFTGTKTLGNSLIYDNGTNVGIGTTTPQALLDVNKLTEGEVARFRGSSANRFLKIESFTNYSEGAGFRFNASSTVGAFQFAITDDVKMYIDYTGNVGIGTTSPTEKLHINGDTRIVGNTYVGGIINAYQGDASIWVPNLGQAFTVKQTTGNVGIGTSSPNKNLTTLWNSSDATVTTGNGIGGGAAGNGVLLYNTNTSANTYANLDFRANNADARIAYVYTGTINEGDFHFITDNTDSPISAMVIKNGGNVGIGTTSPSQKLDVNGNIAMSSGGNIYSSTTLNMYPEGGSVALQVQNTNVRVSSAHDFYVVDGNVGIGTTSPDSKLEVNGSATNTSANNEGDDAIIDFSLSNIAYTDNTGNSITLTNIKDGGAYTLISTSTNVSTEVSFTVPTGFSIINMGTVARTLNKQHIYSFIVAGTNVYVTMGTEN